VYFEPGGGWNDILSVILFVKEYCKKHNRVLLVNGNKSVYKINFSEYFCVPEDPTIIFDTESIKKICTNQSYSIFPNELQHKMLDILEGRIVFKYSKYYSPIYVYGNIPLDLPNDALSETIIVHSRCGGGDGYPLFKQLVFRQNILDICNERCNRLKVPYLCIHIRNTDYKCDYTTYFLENEASIRSWKEIYIATDDPGSIEFYRNNGLNVKNFTTFPKEPCRFKNLHGSDVDQHTKFVDMICDMFIVSRSDKFISNSIGGLVKLLQFIHSNNGLKVPVNTK
jgi:hypothetical protein